MHIIIFIQQYNFQNRQQYHHVIHDLNLEIKSSAPPTASLSSSVFYINILDVYSPKHSTKFSIQNVVKLYLFENLHLRGYSICFPSTFEILSFFVIFAVKISLDNTNGVLLNIFEFLCNIFNILCHADFKIQMLLRNKVKNCVIADLEISLTLGCDLIFLFDPNPFIR